MSADLDRLAQAVDDAVSGEVVYTIVTTSGASRGRWLEIRRNGVRVEWIIPHGNGKWAARRAVRRARRRVAHLRALEEGIRA